MFGRNETVKVDRKTYEALREGNVRLQTLLEERTRALTTLQTSFDWLRVRLHQVEVERARLIENYMGIKIEVPEIVQEKQDRRGAADLSNAVQNFFTDMGDEEAAKQGVSWDEEGNLVHGKK